MDNPIASTTSGSARCAKAQERISGTAPGGSRGVPRRDSDRQLRRRRLSVGTCVSQVRRGFLRVPHEARRHGKERDRAPEFLPSRRGFFTAHVTPLPLDGVRFPSRRDAAHGCLPLRFHGRRDYAAVAPDAFRRTPARWPATAADAATEVRVLYHSVRLVTAPSRAKPPPQPSPRLGLRRPSLPDSRRSERPPLRLCGVRRHAER